MKDDRKRVPGSEKLTRPEDLKSLAKFLGNIKKTQEEHTKLEEEAVGIPGKSTGYFPKIDQLPEDSVKLLDGRKEIVGLSDSVITLDGDFKDVFIERDVVRFEGGNKEVSLSDYLDRLEDDDKVIERLPDAIIGLENNKQETELDTTKIMINNNHEVEGLDDKKIGLDVSEDIELDKNIINLPSVDEKNIKSLDKSIEVTSSGENRVKIEEVIDGYKLEEKGIEKDPTEIYLKNTTVETLEVDREIELSKGSVKIEDDREVKLGDEVEKLDIDKSVELGNHKEVLSNVENDIKDLSSKKINGPEETVDISSLENINLTVKDDKTVNLNNAKIDAPEDEEKISGLYDTAIGTEGSSQWDGKTLYDSNIQSPDLEGEYKDLLNADDLTKYQKVLELSGNLGGFGSKIASLVSAYLSHDTITSEMAEQFDNDMKNILSQMAFLKRNFDNSNEKAKKINSVNRLGNLGTGETIDIAKEFFNESRRDSVVEVPEAANKDTYVEGSGNPEKEKEYTKAEELLRLYELPFIKDRRGYATIPRYQLPAREILDALNPSNYLRHTAEMLFSSWNPSTKAERLLKPALLNEALALLFLAREQLEKLTKANRDRLPGDDAGFLSDLMSSGVSGAAENLKDNALSALQNVFNGAKGVEKTNPLNRPKVKRIEVEVPTQDGSTKTKKITALEETTGFQLGNDRQLEGEKSGSILDSFTKNIANSVIGNLGDDTLSPREYSFSDNYLAGTGIATTLADLCYVTDPSSVNSVESLMDLIKTSSNITTPGKFGTAEEGKYGSMMLDTNSYWEVTMEPFCHLTMNGGYSFLPAIREINNINRLVHGYNTRYSKWVPISSFELDKSKLTSKSLGLYDGEISYPVSAELTNELRLTLVDDQFKSWKNYFQKCAEVSVYNSEAHDVNYYYNDSDKTSVTVVDKTSYAAASYKNVSFLIGIYVMTPQFATIRRFNLLCVLRDYQETFMGDIDAGGYDLNITFSIVGENPYFNMYRDNFARDFDIKKNFETAENRKFEPVPAKKTSSLIKLL